jgi:hypothetical protein
MKAKGKPSKVFGRDEILARLKNEIILVDVPEWGASVRVRPPEFPRICQLRLEAPDNAEFAALLVMSSCVDLKPEDLRMMREGNGLRFSELQNAVYAAVSTKGPEGN